ncbi:manganese-dependent ADP-ribose/CDP-alcohol diphosphatase-like [Denticeps clupeoides]|uniref:manganese-dependent ADP-ribose/CDP-alcohol diphosphatase-like n=1 Tax=Denticeps clupeoides TaxID=299321 RepID=UPI0010A4BDBA|nr:manganese-dependent ADP-ribose/CDP-alcohol diphosphatase-like [Denticeps clupeoides]
MLLGAGRLLCSDRRRPGSAHEAFFREVWRELPAVRRVFGNSPWRGHRRSARRTPGSAMEPCAEPPLFTFGVIADVQYADIDDGANYTRTRARYYRNSVRLLRRACRAWSEEDVRPRFVLQLGDVIDGHNVKHGASERALETVLRELDGCPAEVHHVWGNHEFYNFSRDALLASALNSARLGDGRLAPPGDMYVYHFSPAPCFRLVVLDAYDVSIIGRDETSEKYEEAASIMKEHNSNPDLNHPPVTHGLEQRFVKFNGGFSQDQLQWLDEVLSLADTNQEKVIVVSHLPVHPSSTDPICLAWNHSTVLSILHSHSCVVCFIAGHDHDGGYHQDELGLHYLTLEGVIETPPHSDAYGTVYVYKDHMFLKGRGRIEDRVLRYPDHVNG